VSSGIWIECGIAAFGTGVDLLMIAMNRWAPSSPTA
jgi:hypothetical protein